MKIVISPSKTTNLNNSMYLKRTEKLFPEQTSKILKIMQSMTKEELKKALNIKGNILNKTHHNLQEYDNLESYQAFPSFNGLVFKNIDINSYRETEFNYINCNLLILDAFYGILQPGTMIKPYRLDMKAKLGFNLYHFWDVDHYLEDEIIINLASTEFSKMIQKPMININFLQLKAGKYINQATYSKMARGLFLDFMIKNKVESLAHLLSFDGDNYHYNKELSDETNLTFTR